jgi:pantetheine-phosphate adenylyltransferase
VRPPRELALCPGSFDPATNGHVDLIERAARHLDRVVVGVAANPSKRALFSPAERVAMLQESLAHVGNAEVTSFEGLLVDFARRRSITLVVKGLRAISDTSSELQMAAMNAALLPGLDTVFVAARPALGFVSSSLVKEVASYGGDVSELVPRVVAAALVQRFSERE